MVAVPPATWVHPSLLEDPSGWTSWPSAQITLISDDIVLPSGLFTTEDSAAAMFQSAFTAAGGPPRSLGSTLSGRALDGLDATADPEVVDSPQDPSGSFTYDRVLILLIDGPTSILATLHELDTPVVIDHPYSAELTWQSVVFTADPVPPDPDPPAPTSLPRVVIELGLGADGPTDPDPAWFDITDRVWGAGDGPTVDIVRGRVGENTAGITPGSMQLELDNTDGVFDPDDDGSPFWPHLQAGVPIRVTTRWTDPEYPEVVYAEDVTRMWVEAWPQVDAATDRTVVIDCADILGLLALGDAPATAFHAAVRAISDLHAPDIELVAWWRTAPSGWVDAVTGREGRHTGGLVEVDPLVDGDERSWGQPQGDGFGVLPQGLPGDWPTDSGVDDLVVHAVIRLDGGAPITLLDCARFTVTVNAGNVDVTVRGDSDGYTLRFGTVRLFGGSVRNLTVYLFGNVGDALLFVDGTLISGEVTANPGAGVDPVGDVTVGRGVNVGAGHYRGAVDHLVVWRGALGTDDTAAVAAELTAAARLAWVGDRLDQRVTRIVAGMGATGLLGALDESGVVTLQGYRTADPLDLLGKVEDTEQGRVWVDRHGRLRFWGSSWPTVHPVASEVQARFTDTPSDGGLPMLAAALVRAKDPRKVVNVAQVTSTWGRMQTAEDQVSIGSFGRRNVHLSGLLHSSDRRSRSIAEWLIWSKGEPRWRVHQLSFQVADDPARLARLAQQIDEGWLIEVTRLGVTLPAHVVGVTHRFDNWGWLVTLTLDGTRAGESWFLLDESELDGPDPLMF